LSDTKTDFAPRIVQPTGLEPAWIDPDAYRAVERLRERGHEAYLVGGCVRDLLLGRKPKDFDIATSARPQHVKRAFPRNCRIIGRRFKLAHLHFHQNRKILEVSTFRRTPDESNEGDDLLITHDNEFGTSGEDAVRRDFTMNALFYDPVEDRILDFVGGLEHVHDRVLQTIGDPEVRFREDPVRILRAVKFAGRLGFTIEPETLAAMKRVAPDLSRSARPRLLEEILRLLRAGHAFQSFRLLRDIGALGVLLPLVDEYLAGADKLHRTAFWRLLDGLDSLVLTRGAPYSGVLLGTLFALPVLERITREPERGPAVVEDLLTPLTQELSLPRRDAGCLKRICAIQPRLLGRGRSVRPRALARAPFFAEAVLLNDLLRAALDQHEIVTGGELPDWHGLSVQADPDEDTPALVMVASPRAVEWPVAVRTRSAPTRADDRVGRDRSDQGRPDRIDRVRGDRHEDDARGSHKKKRKKDRKDRRDEGPRQEPRSDRRADRKDKKKRKKDRDRDRDRPKTRAEKRADKVEEIVPELVDTTAFDVELDAKRPPSFGTPLEGAQKKKKRRLPTGLEEDDYKPPLPPGEDAAPPPPPGPAGGDGGTFGDW
jgi:poly(A) polymerase